MTNTTYEVPRGEGGYRRAAEAGDTDAMYNLAVLLEQRGRSFEAQRWYRQAAYNGDVDAMFNLAVALGEEGENAGAAQWYRRAAESGDTEARIILVQHYQRRARPIDRGGIPQHAPDLGREAREPALERLPEGAQKGSSRPRRVVATRIAVACSLLVVALSSYALITRSDRALASQIRSDPDLRLVLGQAQRLVDDGLTAGANYPATYVRDLNTFIQLHLSSGGSAAQVRQALLTFLTFQEPDGDVPDAFQPSALPPAGAGAEISSLEPGLVAFKTTVESDQESSLVQAFAKYITYTHDDSVLDVVVAGQTVRSRLARALQYLMTARLDPVHGLLWGGSSVDWGDFQAGATPVTSLGPASRPAIGVYDNAMFSLALRDFVALPGTSPTTEALWDQRRVELDANIARWLWDPSSNKYRAHIYLDGSPFPAGFDESSVFVEGGTAVAIEAGLLSRSQIMASMAHMDTDVAAAHAQSIGLSVYPPYPGTAFSPSGVSMAPYSYQNGGDWDWFGARMVQDLIANNDPADAYREIKPMIQRVKAAHGFYEWWTLTGQPRGSADFRGSAGELGVAAEELIQWAGHCQLGCSSLRS